MKEQELEKEQEFEREELKMTILEQMPFTTGEQAATCYLHSQEGEGEPPPVHQGAHQVHNQQGQAGLGCYRVLLG